jgi:hypothetical protein
VTIDFAPNSAVYATAQPLLQPHGQTISVPDHSACDSPHHRTDQECRNHGVYHEHVYHNNDIPDVAAAGRDRGMMSRVDSTLDLLNFVGGYGIAAQFAGDENGQMSGQSGQMSGQRSIPMGRCWRC